MVVEDPSLPADVRFLHVLQMADASAAAPTPPVLLSGSVNGGSLGTAQGDYKRECSTLIRMQNVQPLAQHPFFVMQALST